MPLQLSNTRLTCYMHGVCSAYAISIQTASWYFEIISVIIKCDMTVLSTKDVEQKGQRKTP